MTDSQRSTSRTKLTRVHDMSRREARQQAKRIPWERLAFAVEQYLEWRAFLLWFRAIAEAECGVPPWLSEILETRCPGLLPAARGTEKSHARAAASEFWLELSHWIDARLFREASEEGWLPALRYYASCDLRWEQLWSYWEECDAQWQRTKPASYPALEEWRQAAESRVTACTDEPGRRAAVEAASRVSPDRLKQAVAAYVDWEAFAFWVRAVVAAERRIPAEVAGRLAERCPGILDSLPTPSGDGTQVWLHLIGWIEDHVFGAAKSEGWLEAVRFFARSSLRAERTAEYRAHCELRWSRHRPARYPDFEEWRRAADRYTEAPR